MIAPVTSKPSMTVVNPDAEPTDAWIRAIAVMLLADVDREFEETQQTEKPSTVGQPATAKFKRSNKTNGNTDTKAKQARVPSTTNPRVHQRILAVLR